MENTSENSIYRMSNVYYCLPALDDKIQLEILNVIAIWRTSDHFSVFHTKYHFYWLNFVQLRVIFATFMSISSTRRKKFKKSQPMMIIFRA